MLIRGIDAKGQGFDLFSKQVHVRMAEGGLRDGKIVPEAMSRGIKCLKEYRELIDELGVDNIIAFGTSVFRDAKNARLFVEEGTAILDSDIEIISGEREAQLIWKGVMNSMAKPISKPYLILDIGGGSIELIIGVKRKILWWQSLPLGGLRLAARFQRHDPISQDEIEELRGFLDEQLVEVKKQLALHKPKTLIGAAGSFETLSKMEHVNILNKAFPEFSTYVSIKPDHFYDLAKLLKKSSQLEMREIPGIDNFRIPLMPVSVILIESILGLSSFTEMAYSDFSMKEGIFFEYIEQNF